MEIRKLIIESKHGTFTVRYDAEDAPKVEPYKWHVMKGHSTYYVRRQTARPNRRNLLLHREITECPKGKMIDHKNGNGLDNRRENLRICTMSENMMNRGKTKVHSGKYKGVYDCGDSKTNPYTAKIQKDGKVYHLGHHRTLEEAAKVYDVKAKELHGVFAKLNFPEDEQ
jgi:hypothetical protein